MKKKGAQGEQLLNEECSFITLKKLRSYDQDKRKNLLGLVCSRSSGCEQPLQSPTSSPPSHCQLGVSVLPVRSVSGLSIGPVGLIPTA